MAPAELVSGQRVFGPYRILRELAPRTVPTFIARNEPDTTRELLILQGFRDAEFGDIARHDAELAAGVRHPNIASRVRCVEGAPGEILVTSDYVEGLWLSELLDPARVRGSALTARVLLRAVVDVLTGIQWLHQVDRAGSERLKAFHGQLCPTHVLIGVDGIARITNVVRTYPSRSLREAHELLGYLAPETLMHGWVDGRSDVYAVGVMLQEILGQRSPFSGSTADEALVQALKGTPPPSPLREDAPWSGPLLPVAGRATAPDAKARFPTPAEMLAHVRKVAGAHIAASEEVGPVIKAIAGQRLGARRAELGASLRPGRMPEPTSDVRPRRAREQAPPEIGKPLDSGPPDAKTELDISVAVEAPTRDDDEEEGTTNVKRAPMPFPMGLPPTPTGDEMEPESLTRLAPLTAPEPGPEAAEPPPGTAWPAGAELPPPSLPPPRMPVERHAPLRLGWPLPLVVLLLSLFALAYFERVRLRTLFAPRPPVTSVVTPAVTVAAPVLPAPVVSLPTAALPVVSAELPTASASVSASARAAPRPPAHHPAPPHRPAPRPKASAGPAPL